MPAPRKMLADGTRVKHIEDSTDTGTVISSRLTGTGVKRLHWYRVKWDSGQRSDEYRYSQLTAL